MICKGIRFALVIGFGLILIASLGYGQIYINPDDFPNQTGLTLTFFSNTTTSVMVDVGESGPNQTWNFTQGPEEQEVTEQIVRASETPFYDNFPNSNFCRLSNINMFGIPGDVYTYREISDQQLLLLGLGAEVMEYPLPIALGEGLLEYPMPLSYQDSWDNTINFDTVFTIPNPDTTIPLDSVDVRIELTLGDQANVDAWGTLDGPMGNQEVLRVLHETGVEVTVSVWAIIIWLPVWDSSFVQFRYEWLTNEMGPIVTITSQPGETNPNFTDASRVLRLIDMQSGVPNTPEPAVPITMRLAPNYPNPFNESTALTFSLPWEFQSQANLSVYNVLGRKIVTLWQGAADGGTHQVVWDGRNSHQTPAASGVYFVRLTWGAKAQSLQVIKLD